MKSKNEVVKRTFARFMLPLIRKTLHETIQSGYFNEREVYNLSLPSQINSIYGPTETITVTILYILSYNLFVNLIFCKTISFFSFVIKLIKTISIIHKYSERVI